ncbi:DUF5958 family protein [Streptomyces albidoflavus]|uniref:DUF5958 family protein n=1 Tax=Streptomyces albidoflavus TaxID=1886 RepID=UPI0034E1EBB6
MCVGGSDGCWLSGPSRTCHSVKNSLPGGERVTVKVVGVVETSGRTTIRTAQTTRSWTQAGRTLYLGPGAGEHLRSSERIINEVAQGLRSLEDAVAWFSSLEQVDQRAVLHEVARYAMQAHATVNDARDGLLRSRVKPTMTPAVLIVREPILEQMGKIINLPPGEHVKSFRVLSSTFAVADTRRRETECRGSCSHAWHNLS